MTTHKEALKLALEALKLIAAQDQGCGGTYTEAEAWRSAKSIALANIAAIKEALAQPEQEPDYAWPTIEDYENEVGFSVGDAFKMGWSMARTTNDLFVQMVEQS